jgi:hypothetical protein
MSKKNSKIDTARQMDLDVFGLIREVSHRQAEAAGRLEESGKFNIDIRLRELLSSALKRSRLSRYEIAGKMSELLGVETTKSQLDSWTAESKECHRFPFAYAAAFCAATGDRSILRIQAELCGGYFIDGEDAIRLELGKIEEQKEQLASREKAIREFLREGK